MATAKLQQISISAKFTEAGIGELGKIRRGIFEFEAVGDPDVGVDFSVADELDDAVKISRQGIARGEQGELAAVENRSVGKSQV